MVNPHHYCLLAWDGVSNVDTKDTKRVCQARHEEGFPPNPEQSPRPEIGGGFVHTSQFARKSKSCPGQEVSLRRGELMFCSQCVNLASKESDKAPHLPHWLCCFRHRMTPL